MKRIAVMFAALTANISLSSGAGFEEVLSVIETNNTTLQALKQQCEAQKTGNRTGIYLPGPEVGANYLFGNDTEGGNRTDFSVSQSFDFPTAYRYRANIASGRDTRADLEYIEQRRALLLEASRICAAMVYRNVLQAEMERRTENARQLQEACRLGMESGEKSIIDYNRARLNYLNVHTAAETNRIERRALQAELVRMNGGVAIEFEDMVYPPAVIAADFEVWYAEVVKNNYLLRSIDQDVELSKQEEKLNRAMSLPGFSVGYMSESIAGSVLQGPTVGITLPLWESRNSVKYSRLQTRALEKHKADALMQFRSVLLMQYEKSLSLQSMLTDLQKSLSSVGNDNLKKAFDSGEITLGDYLNEMSAYYDITDAILAAERDLCYALCELMQWEDR